MSKGKTTSGNRTRQPATLAELPFCKLVEQDGELRKLRAQYAALPAEQRKQAARWAYESAQASMLMARMVSEPDLFRPDWSDALVPLAIDPEYAPAMLTVGSLEYQFGRIDEAMKLFLQLTKLPEDTGELSEIIDKAGGFLIDEGDHVRAEELYSSAVESFPENAIFHNGRGYCAATNGLIQESVFHHRRAVELQPKNHLFLNDLGYCLLQVGQYDEAEEILQRAALAAPPDFDLADANLDYLREVRGGLARPDARQTR